MKQSYKKKAYEVLFSIIYKGYYVYRKTKEWLEIEDFYRKHINVKVVGGSIRITFQDHPEYIAELNQTIKRLQKKKKPENVIKFALEQSIKGCNFVIFQKKDDENKFIQFWTARGKLDHDFPMSESNGLHLYRLSIIGLLSEMGFVNREVKAEVKTFHPYKYYFWIEKEDDDLWRVKANFHKDLKSAKEYTINALKNVLKTDIRNLEIKIS